MAEEQKLKFLTKVKKDPFVPLGMATTAAVIGYGIFDYKKWARRGMSLSVYMMQYRVKAQGAVVGVITLGVMYNMLRDLSHGKVKVEAAP